jgi:NADH:ubiquinone oxidoreductase subunit 5 (subunit L)/multisubunit Na+/H+ antiporter MnhA subunit
MNGIGEYLWLIPALPLLAAGLSAVARQQHRTLAASLAIGSMIIAFVLSCAAFLTTLGHTELVHKTHSIAWFQIGDTWLKLGWVLDPLTACMLVMVTFVGTLIFIYSVGYMAHDQNFTRFFCFLSLFAAAMLGVVIANSLLLQFICWELVGVASYLLIGFWYHKPSAAAAAKKAFIVTRIGDVGLFLGLLWLYSETGTLLFYDHGQGCLEKSALAAMVTQTTSLGILVSTGISLLIFCGAIGKSGQVPLHVWLPDAMEGPTPVSALIHAATMVAAGVFLVARVYPLMEAMPAHATSTETGRSASSVAVANPGRTLSPAPSVSERDRSKAVMRGEPSSSPSAATAAKSAPLQPPDEEKAADQKHGTTIVSAALKVVTWVGAITAVFAAFIAVAQTDIKRILAYSTVSQLGYMMMGLGVGGIAVGMFHLITHAFFKALLFLGAGSVIHGCHEEQDIRRMGGLRKAMPITFATYAVGMMALAGVPIFFSGFWSKDEILHAAHGWSPSHGPFYLGLLGAFLTAFYMTRQVCYVFFGRTRLAVHAEPEHSGSHAATQPEHSHATVHESPSVMTTPLVILAAFAVVLGFFGTPAWPWFQGYLTGEPASFHFGNLFHWETLSMMLLSTVVVVIGLAMGFWFYGLQTPYDAEATDPLERIRPDVFAVLREKLYVDEFYEATAVRFNAWSAWFCDWLDRWIWSGAVQACSFLVLGLSWLNRFFDEYVINRGFDEGCRRLRLGGKWTAGLQDGQAQHYLRVIGITLTVLLLILTWGWSQ